MERLQQQKIQEKLNIAKIKSRFQNRTDYIAKRDNQKSHKLFRDLDLYDELFKNELLKYKEFKTQIPMYKLITLHYVIIDFMMDYIRTHKIKEINVFDDGLGHGNFLKEMKSRIQERGVKCKTTGISLTDTIKLENKSMINKIHIPNVADHLPEEKYDFIFSSFGGLYYSIPEINKEILLKYLYSLKKNGFAILITNPENNPKGEYGMKRFEIALQKRGFELFYEPDNTTLIIQRTNVFKNQNKVAQKIIENHGMIVK